MLVFIHMFPDDAISLSFSYFLPLAVSGVCCCSVVSGSFATPWTVVCQALCLWDFPGKNTAVACHFFLQGIFLTQGSNLSLLHLLNWQKVSLPLGSNLVYDKFSFLDFWSHNILLHSYTDKFPKL